MPDTQINRSMPKPITVVLQRHGALQTAYVGHRASLDEIDAFVATISDVLTETEARDLIQLISGSFDAAYDARRGGEFGRVLIEELEQCYQDVGRVSQRTEQWRDLDAVAVAQALAEDTSLATLFTQALDEHNAVTARLLVARAVQAIVERASTARTPTGRKRALERAAAVLHRCAAERGELARWCEAVSLGLGGHERPRRNCRR